MNEMSRWSEEQPRQPLARDGVVFDIVTIRGRKPTQLENAFLALAANHVGEHPDEPMDLKAVARKIGTSKQVLSLLRIRLREAGLEIPLSVREHASRKQEDRRQERIGDEDRLMMDIMTLRTNAGLGTKEISIRIGRPEKVVGNRMAKLLKDESVLRLRNKKMSGRALLEFDKEVANYYRQDFTYNEIAWMIDSNYTTIVGSLARSAEVGQITRRGDPRKNIIKKSTNSS